MESEEKWVVFKTGGASKSYMSRQYRFGKAMAKYLKMKEGAEPGSLVRLMKVVEEDRVK